METDLPAETVRTTSPVAGSYSVVAFGTAWPSSPVTSVETVRSTAS